MGRRRSQAPDQLAGPPLGERLLGAWRVLLGGVPPGELPLPNDTGRLEAQSIAAGLRIELEEALAETDVLRRSLDTERAARSDAVGAALDARLEPVLADAAAVMSQLSLQARLIEEGKPVQARDVSALSSGLSRAVERLGLSSFGVPGEETQFDPALHELLGGGRLLQSAPALVRMPGYRFGARVVRKAMVVERPGV